MAQFFLLNTSAMDATSNSVLLLSFLLFVYDAFCLGQLCGHGKVCQKWNECPEGLEMWRGGRVVLCGRENSVDKLCCKRIIPKAREIAVAIAREKCNEYGAYRFWNFTIPGPLPGDPDKMESLTDCYSVEPVITKGKLAAAKEFPHMALIGYGDSLKSVRWLCGGSLISERFVMSAAHCSTSAGAGEAKWVLLGDLNIMSQTDDAMPKTYRIIRRIDHPNYEQSSVYHDITLFQLNSTVELSPYVRPTCLYTVTGLPANVGALTVTGWGQTGPVDSSSDHLLKASIFPMDNKRCNRSYRGKAKLKAGFHSKLMVCAGDMNMGKDTCQGDSGGPLQIPVSDTFCMWSQVGITSYGSGICGDKETPAIYTRVANYIEWIQSIVWP